MKRPLRILTSLASSSLILSSQLVFLPAPVQAQTIGGTAGCPAGTRENTVNFVQNSTFSTNAGTGNGVATPAASPPFNPFPGGLSFTSILPYRGDALYPDDARGGGLSIQDERFNGGQVLGAPGVVNGRGVTAAESAALGTGAVAIPTYLYSNPNLSQVGVPVTNAPVPNGAAPPAIWIQTITGLSGSTVYNFKALVFNLLVNTGAPGSNGVPPRIRLLVGPPGGTLKPTPGAVTVGDLSPIPGFPLARNERQAWVPVQVAFTTDPGQTQVELQIVDEAQDIFGDDFGLTAIGLRECVPNIGVAKQAGTPVQNQDGSYTIPYSVLVKNLAPVFNPDPYRLNNVQLAENLTTTFAGATIVAIGNVRSQTLTVNPNFNGTTDINLLQSNVNTLAAQGTGTVTFDVRIIPGTGGVGQGPYTNQVLASGASDSGVPTSNRSFDGTNPDPSGTGTPNPNGTPTVVPLTFSTVNANFSLVKRITNVTRNGSPLAGVNFAAFVDDPGSQVDTDPAWASLPQGSPIGIINLTNTTPVQAGDEVEYTIYFLSNGSAPVLNTSICDLIPAGMSLIPLSYQIGIGSSLVTSGGTSYTPLAPLPSNNSCADQRNPNGAVIFNLDQVTNVPTNNVGFVRLRTRVN